MADRAYHKAQTQGVGYVVYDFAITLASGVPVFSKGDKAASAAGSYCTLADTGTGVITLATKDPFMSIVNCLVSRSLATPTGNGLVDCGLPTQDATTKKWSVAICTYTNVAGTHSAADMVDGDLVNVRLTLRNSQVLP